MDQAEQMALAEHDHVVKELSAHGPDELLSLPILPGRPRRDSQGFEAKPADPLVESPTVDARG